HALRRDAHDAVVSAVELRPGGDVAPFAIAVAGEDTELLCQPPVTDAARRPDFQVLDAGRSASRHRSACGDPLFEYADVDRVGLESTPPAVRDGSGRLEQQQAARRVGGVDAPPHVGAGDGLLIVGRLGGEDGQLESALAVLGGVTGPRVAAAARQDGQHLIGEPELWSRGDTADSNGYSP